jgi:hypothetical protein
VLSIVIGEAMAQLKVVRLLRLMRLIKLIRLVRASRMFKRWETHMAIDYGASDAPVSTSTPPSLRLAPAPPPPPPNPAFTGTLALVKCVVLVCVGGHWFACAWAIQAGFADSPLQTWCLPLYLPSPSLPSSPTTATIATTQAGRVRLLLACGERQRLGVLACLGSVRGLAVLRDDDNHLDRLR